MRKFVSFNVAPRYSGGSPAGVDEETALRVAAEEKESIRFVLEGCEGPEAKSRAERLGLRGIVEQRTEKGSGKKEGWEVLDLCTGERFFRLSHAALRKLGWVEYRELPKSKQKLIDDNPPTDIEDPKRGWYQFTEPRFGGSWDWGFTPYRPEPIKENAA